MKILTVVLVAMAISPAAHAVYWHSKSHPLKVVHDSHLAGQAYGNFYDRHHEWARSASNRWATRYSAGTNGIYVQTDYYFKTSGDWKLDSWMQTHRSHCRCWVHGATNLSFDPTASAARGGIRVMEDIPHWYDPQSPYVYPTFSY